MDFFDVIIIGAGPAGSVASAYLHKQEKKVLVLEKETFPRFVIGESLLPNCMNHLEESGLLEAVKKKEFQIKTGAIFHSGNDKCAFEFSNQFSKGWSWTWQVQRADFDKILIDEVKRIGVNVQFNCEVVKVELNDDHQIVSYNNIQGEPISVKSKFVMDASGYGRVLPRLFQLDQPSDLIPRGAVYTHLVDLKRTDKAGNNIFVHSFNNNSSWLWAIPFSDGTTSVGVVGENEYVEKLYSNNAKEFRILFNSFEGLKGRFKDAEFLFEPRSILGYSIGVKQMYGNGYVLCGNTTEFLDPIFSSGVTLATASGLLAAKIVNKQLNRKKVNWEKEYEDVLKEGIEVFRSYVNAWYNGDLQTIIFADKIQKEFKQQICSVLAGYIWDSKNPFVKKHDTILRTLAKVINLDKARKKC